MNSMICWSSYTSCELERCGPVNKKTMAAKNTRSLEKKIVQSAFQRTRSTNQIFKPLMNANQTRKTQTTFVRPLLAFR